MKAIQIYELETGFKSPNNQLAFNEWQSDYVKWLEKKVIDFETNTILFEKFNEIFIMGFNLGFTECESQNKGISEGCNLEVIVNRSFENYQSNKMKIVSINHMENYRLSVLYGNGTCKIIDLENFLKSSNHPLIIKYLDVDLFSQVYLDKFGTPCWGDNEFDINPESILKDEFTVG